MNPDLRRAKPASSRLDEQPISLLRTTDHGLRTDPGWTRTIVAWMWARSLGRWTTGSRVAEVGVEPTNDHQALDLVALPVLRTRPSSCGGRIRTGVERLMRPCWEPDSSPLRNEFKPPEPLRCPARESNPHPPGFKPDRSADWRSRASAPASRAGPWAIGPGRRNRGGWT